MAHRRAKTKARSDTKDTSGTPEVVRIRLLGSFEVIVGSQTIEEDAWRLRKAASLIKLLALSPKHRLHREQVMEMLWPASGKSAASNNLRQTLHAARRTLEPDLSTTASRYLQLQGEQLLLCQEGQLWVDVDAFEEAARSARRSREVAAYEAALELYAGDLLPQDRYEEWAQDHRQRLREVYLSLLLGLARLHEERREYDSAVEALGKVIAEEPTREEAHAGLMRLYALKGTKAQALAQYARLEKVLLKELGSDPSASSRALKEEIEAGRFPPPSGVPPSGVSPSAPHSPSSSPEEKSGAPTGHNLPAARSSFVGRERELAQVKKELATTRLLTLTGAGGTGKTRLALEVARDLVGAYPDGVWLVELAPLSEEGLVPKAVAEALEVPERPHESLADTLADVLRDREMFLVMDNCEHLLEASARLVDLLLDSCPQLRMLATSREALGVEGELRWAVPPLSVPKEGTPSSSEELEGYEAVRLFVERARRHDQSFSLNAHNAPAVAEICTRLEGIPLAIELAAARVGVLSVGQIALRLTDCLKLLSGGARTATSRQRTLKGALDWSYDLLPESERALFRRLSVFAGGWELEASEAVGSGEGIEEEEVLDVLSGLVWKSLVVTELTEQGEVRYRMLEPVRQYALEKLEQSGRFQATRRAHAEYFLTLAEEAERELIGPHEARWIDRLEEELDNFRVALSWALEEGEAEFGLRLAGALMSFWFWRGNYGEGRGWIEAALSQEGPTSAVARVKALGAASLLVWGQSDYAQAKEAAEEGLRLSKEAGIEGSRAGLFLGGTYAAFFLNLLAFVSIVEGDHERTTALGQESLALNQHADDLQGIVCSLIMLATASFLREDYDQAEKLFAESLSLVRELGSAYWRFMCLAQWGWTALHRGDHERTTLLLEEAVALARERRREFMGLLPTALDTLGWSVLLGGDLERAKAMFEENLTLFKELGDKRGASYSLEGLACVAGAEGDVLRAARLFGAAEALMEAIGSRLAPQEIDMLEPYRASVRSRLGEEAWDEAVAEGGTMGLDKAIEYALSDGESTTTSSQAPEDQPPAHDQPFPPTALTHREEEVAHLLARGLTNRQISEELFLSERTVHRHVSNVLKKLGVPSREQVGAKMAERHPSNGD